MSNSKVLIGIEPMTRALIEELRPLWQRCWDECSEIKGTTCAFHGERGFLIEPDIEQYLLLGSQNSLPVVTLRVDGVLHGYAIGILYRALHHRPVIVGNVDSCYLDPQYRSYIRSVIKALENEFESHEVVIIGWPTSPDGHLYSVLKALGYIPDDIVMEKRLCALPPQ